MSDTDGTVDTDLEAGPFDGPDPRSSLTTPVRSGPPPAEGPTAVADLPGSVPVDPDPAPPTMLATETRRVGFAAAAIGSVLVPVGLLLAVLVSPRAGIWFVVGTPLVGCLWYLCDVHGAKLVDRCRVYLCRDVDGFPVYAGQGFEDRWGTHTRDTEANRAAGAYKPTIVRERCSFVRSCWTDGQTDRCEERWIRICARFWPDRNVNVAAVGWRPTDWVWAGLYLLVWPAVNPGADPWPRPEDLGPRERSVRGDQTVHLPN